MSTEPVKSIRMVAAALITNILPLCITSGLMGYFGIPLKPSTILVFSIAFGISVDNAIQFMVKYRHDLERNRGDVRHAVESAVQAVLDHLAEGQPRSAQYKPAEFIDARLLTDMDKSGYIDKLYGGQVK